MYNQLKIIITLLFVFILNISHGQYNSIFDETYTEWNYMTLFCDAIFTTTFQHSKDTMISNTSYKIIDDFGFLREDENNSKVWYRSSESEEEQLIMDLDLEVGDLFEINSISYEVEETFVVNGVKIIQFDYLPINCGIVEPLRFIEGQGPNLSFKYILTGDEFDLSLLRCYTRDSITYNFFVDQLGEECISNETSTNEIIESEIIIYPNPFSEQFHLKFENDNERSIIITDFLGRNIYAQTFQGVEVNINTDQFGEGLYMLQIREGTNIRSRVIIKKPR